MARGADPLPSLPDAVGPYRIEVIKDADFVSFSIGRTEDNILRIFDWHDDGESTGPILEGGKIGFRQMKPMIGEYANLSVERLERS